MRVEHGEPRVVVHLEQDAWAAVGDQVRVDGQDVVHVLLHASVVNELRVSLTRRYLVLVACDAHLSNDRRDELRRDAQQRFEHLIVHLNVVSLHVLELGVGLGPLLSALPIGLCFGQNLTVLKDEDELRSAGGDVTSAIDKRSGDGFEVTFVHFLRVAKAQLMQPNGRVNRDDLIV